MPCYGYIKGSDELVELNDLTIQIGSKDLRVLSKFLSQCADEIDNGDIWEHKHIIDMPKSNWTNFDVIVFRSLVDEENKP